MIKQGVFHAVCKTDRRIPPECGLFFHAVFYRENHPSGMVDGKISNKN